MFRQTLLGLAVLGIALFSSGAAGACEGKNIQFSDDFGTPDPSWAPPNTDNVKSRFENKKYILDLKPDGSFNDWADSFVYSGPVNICATVTLPTTPALGGIGLLFWVATDKNEKNLYDLYSAVVTPDREFWVSRYFNGNWSKAVAIAQSDAIKPGEANELELRLQANTGTFFVNGKQLAQFRGQPPKSFRAGLTASGPSKEKPPADGKFTVVFQNFQVTN